MVVGSSWIMGSGDWFKTIINKGKTNDRPKQSNGFKWKSQSKKASSKLFNGSYSINKQKKIGLNCEEVAASQIQTAYRGYQARKILRQLKLAQRLRVLSDGGFVQRQTSNTLYHVKCWSRIQMEIRARRASMATEGRIKQKKHENQVKLEAKLHDLEVEWCGKAETMQEILSKVYQREAAAVKRERAMAYAFSHQWRAHSGGVNHGHPHEFGKTGNWGWSWMERWIAARPWEMRISTTSKVQSKPATKTIKMINSPLKPSNSTTRIYAKKISLLEDENAVNYEQFPASATTQTCEVA